MWLKLADTSEMLPPEKQAFFLENTARLRGAPRGLVQAAGITACGRSGSVKSPV